MYNWKCLLKNGSILEQYDDKREPKEISSDTIDHLNVETFVLFNGENLVYILHMDPGQRLIYRRRTELAAGERIPLVCHLVGWQMTVSGENVQSIAYCFEDGVIESVGKFRDNHPWFYSVVPTKKEMEENNAANSTI